jgi:hypothetical protein
LVPKGRGDLGAGATYFGGRVKNNSDIMGNLQEDALEDHNIGDWTTQYLEITL